MERSKLNRKILPLIVLFLAVIPLLRIGDFVLRLLLTILIFVIMGESWNIISGYTGYFSFGQTFFFGIGAYVTALLARNYSVSPFLSAPLCGLLAMVLAMGFGIITLRLRGAYFTLSTLVIMLLARAIVENADKITGGGKGIALPFPGIDYSVFLIVIYYTYFTLSLLSVCLAYRIANSKYGLAIKCIREDEEAAEVLGIDTVKCKMFAYVFSALFPAMVGAVWSYDMGYIWPSTAFDINVEAMTVTSVIFGGIGTIAGPIIGSLCLVLLREVLRLTLTGFGSIYLITYGIILIFAVIYCPDGIGKKVIAAITKR